MIIKHSQLIRAVWNDPVIVGGSVFNKTWRDSPPHSEQDETDLPSVANERFQWGSLCWVSVPFRFLIKWQGIIRLLLFATAANNGP